MVATVTKISEMEKNKEYLITLLITSLEQKVTRYGADFWKITATDGEQEISGSRFDESFRPYYESEEYIGKVVDVYVTSGDYITFGKMRLHKTQNIEDFVRTVPHLEEMYEEIVSSISTMETPLKKIVLKIYGENREKFLRWTATIDNTQRGSYRAGVRGSLLYHTYRCMKSAEALCSVYPETDREVLEVGVALHDIGKLVEYETDELGQANETSEGVLEGHTLMGLLMVQKTIGELKNSENFQDFQEEDLKNLMHLMISCDTGASVPPATLEAMLLREVNQIDAEVYTYEEEVGKLKPGEFVERVDGVTVYRPASTNPQ